jgi:hypothetical protein
VILYIKRACELNKSHIISTDEDPGLRIESFAVINLRGVSTNKTIICFIAMQTYKELKAMLHGAIFLATCNAILLLRDVKLPNTSFHHTLLMFSQHIENSSLISLMNISQE